MLDPQQLDKANLQRRMFSMVFGPQVEEAYTGSKTGSLIYGIVQLMLVFTLVSFPWFLVGLASEERLTMTEVCSGIHFALGLLIAIMSRFLFLERGISFFTGEVISTTLMMVCLVAFLGVDALTIEAYLGTSSDDAVSNDWRVMHTSIRALQLQCILAISHSVLPVRWFVIFAADIAFAVCFVCYCSVNADMNTALAGIIIGFVAFIAIESTSMRSRELQARLRFASSLETNDTKAKDMSCNPAMNKFSEPEQLSEKPPSEAGDETQEQDDGETSAEETVVSTTATGLLFQEAEANQKDAAILARLEALGEQEHWLLDREDLEVSEKKVLGKGGFGEVRAGTHCCTPVAVKLLKTSAERDGDVDTITNELRVLRHLRHPHISLFYGACIDVETGSILIVLERLRGQPLDVTISRLKAWKAQSPYHVRQKQIMMKLCQAVCYLHSQTPCIVHGDLKPCNIIVERSESDFSPKLLDFGLSRLRTRNSKACGGTPAYLAPEIMLNPAQRPSANADVFALGRLLFFMASGRRPLSQYSNHHVISLVRRGKMPDMGWLPSTWLLTQWREVIDGCLGKAASRPCVSRLHEMIRLTGSSKKEREESKESLRSKDTSRDESKSSIDSYSCSDTNSVSNSSMGSHSYVSATHTSSGRGRPDGEVSGRRGHGPNMSQQLKETKKQRKSARLQWAKSNMMQLSL